MRWDILVSALALPGFLLSIPPVVAHIQNRNFAATALVLATMVLNLQTFVNALIWPKNNVEQWWDGQVLCDIEVKLFLGLDMVIAGAVTSILRQMAIILDPNGMTVTPSPRQQACKVAFELCFCVFMPSIMMAAHYVVQPERYWILPVTGCMGSFDNSSIAILLLFTWPMFVYFLGGVYCIVSIKRLRKQRRETASVLSNMPSTTRSRFTRLFNLACILLVVYGPLALFALSQNWSIGLHPFDWNFIHPADWKNQIYKLRGPVSLQPNRWMQILTGYLCFAFFGLGHDATEIYKSWMKGTRSATKILFHRQEM